MPMESWTSQFRQSALKRIREYETFLESCGITPVAGTELEFHFSSPQQSSRFQRLRDIQEFNRSSFVEALKDEAFYDVGETGVGEIAIGKGPNSRTEIYPKGRYPSTIARVTQSAGDILEQGGSKYGMDINFGERFDKIRIRSLQCNISLWNSADRTPLFLNNADCSYYTPNTLTDECAVSLIEAQKALSALVSPHEASFTRYKEKNAFFCMSDDKSNRASVSLRENSDTPFVNSRAEAAQHNPECPPSFYFEDRLASSEADPALAMLITLSGIANGVKSYMDKKGLVDAHGVPAPEKMKAHINSPQFFETASAEQDYVFIRNIPANHGIIPQNHSDALSNLKANEPLARETMGDEFYETFCAAYEKQAQQQKNTRVRRFFDRYSTMTPGG